MDNPAHNVRVATGTRTVAQLVDLAAICEALQNWGLFRDRGDWDGLRSVYARDATMQTTWMNGSAAEFVDMSQRMSAGPARPIHYIGMPIVKLNGAIAVAQTRIKILVRAPLDGVLVDATCHGWFVDRLVKLDGNWLIKSRVPLYERDRLDAVDPAVSLQLDAEALALYPACYKHMAYMQSRVGAPINMALPSPGSPEQQILLSDCESWLAAGKP